MILSPEQVGNLIKNYPNRKFYASRMDEYTKKYVPKNTKLTQSVSSRTTCCHAQYLDDLSQEGYEIFVKLLADRGAHYKTTYTLMVPLFMGEAHSQQYKGKRKKHLIKCEAHNQTFSYSMMALNTITSCPCPECRVDPKHKNICVDIVKKRNAGREGLVIRHASRVKAKYNNTCALSGQNFDLQHHHVDGQDFYENLKLFWDCNGICLCAIIHRNYHNEFLRKHSCIAKQYEAYEDSNTLNQEYPLEEEKGKNNPDFSFEGPEVSRYTFLEFLKFLEYDLKTNGGYVQALNTRLIEEQKELSKLSSGQKKENAIVGKITLESVKSSIKAFCDSYKGENWVFATKEGIPFANDRDLWDKVDNSWN